jgi:hypothetical protein
MHDDQNHLFGMVNKGYNEATHRFVGIEMGCQRTLKEYLNMLGTTKQLKNSFLSIPEPLCTL